MTDTPTAPATSSPAPAAPTYTTEADLRTALVAALQGAQAIIAANTSLFPKTLPADLFQLNVTLGVRIKSLPIGAA